MSAFRLTEKQKAGMGKYRLFPCNNCGGKHWGIYTYSSHFEYGDEVDFVWCTPDGMPRRCVNGHDRDPCNPKECVWCWLDERRAPAEEAGRE